MNNMIHHKMYFKVAKEQLSEARRRETSVRNWLTDTSPWIKQDDIDKSYYEFSEAAVTSVIFSGLTIESYINYYGISRLTKSQFENYLDKLDVLAKWIVIPKFITGNAIDTGCEAIALLLKLIQSRNRLVHYKSSGNTPQEFYNNLKNFDAQDQNNHLPWLEDAETGVKAVYKLIEEMTKIDSSINRTEIEWEEDADNWYEALSI